MPITCAQCGMFDGHFAGCPTLAVERELERRRQEARRATFEREFRERIERLRAEARPRAERDVEARFNMGGALTAAQMQAMVEARVELDVAERISEDPEQVARLRRMRDELDENVRRELAETERMPIETNAVARGMLEALGIPNEILRDLPIRPGRFSQERPPCAGNRHTTVQVEYDQNGVGYARCTTCGHRTDDVVVAQRTSADIPTRTSPVSHRVERLPGNVPIRCSCGWEVTASYLMGLSSLDIRGMIEAHMAGATVGPQPREETMPGLPEGTKVCPSCGNKSIREARRSGIRQCKEGHHWNRFEMIVGGPTYENAMKKPSWETPEMSEPAIMPRRSLRIEDAES